MSLLKINHDVIDQSVPLETGTRSLARDAAVLRAAIIIITAITITTGELLRADPRPLNINPTLIQATKALAPASPDGYRLDGNAAYGSPGSPQDSIGRVVRFRSRGGKPCDTVCAGSLSQTISGISATQGRWYRFRIRGMAQEGFHVQRDALYLQVEFFRDAGRNSLDHVKKSIYPQVDQERSDLSDKGTNRNLGPGAWRSYDLDFRTPFPEVDTLRLTAGFSQGAGRSRKDEFWISEFTLVAIPEPGDFTERIASKKTPPAPLPSKSLIPLGGRWFYDARGEAGAAPSRFNHANADRLYYRTDRFEAPFADNMTAWLRKGYRDRAGNLVKEDRFIPENVTLTFTESALVVHSRNLPNHPTAVFPDRRRALDGNPNTIREQNATWFIPLEPRVDPAHFSLIAGENNGALPGGPIGIAVNGVVFFNPFDADSVDAIWRLDRCCGHPSPGSEYHYHKYPVCVKSPWNDDGTHHSPLIGFAFDGFPVFGPYEAAGELAKDSHDNPLNDFNMHFDEARGWHYHVTPGKFPHILGGYWGIADARNRHRPPRRDR